MKYVKYLLIVIVYILMAPSLHAKQKETPRTDTIFVKGNCDMCKKNIETAADIKGVRKASWNKDSHLLVVSYWPSKTTNEKIQQSVANAGYDTEKFRADDKVYKALHTCCQYER